MEPETAALEGFQHLKAVFEANPWACARSEIFTGFSLPGFPICYCPDRNRGWRLSRRWSIWNFLHRRYPATQKRGVEDSEAVTLI
jgi:hypothetical protein